ncbi:MAG: ribonuclease E/G [Alphaproteobacteria bacterium]|nr:ribonuclease E/G [Alphaproteobacteria bacterium]MCW5738669.1 ribonuclease E/G [Alphaproteobacteria bacterium]
MSGVDRVVCHEGEAATIIASLAGARLLDVAVRPRGRPDFEGAIVLGRVERYSPELDAAFVDIGQARGGFLRRLDMVGFEDGRPPPAGMPLLVQVSRDPTEDKGARLTMNLGLVGRFVVFKPYEQGLAFSRRIEDDASRGRLAAAMANAGAGEEGGYTVRTAAATVAPEAVAREAQGLTARWESLRTRALASTPPTTLHAEPHPLLRVQRDHGGTLAEIVVDDRNLGLRLRQAIDSAGDRTNLRVVESGDGAVLDSFDIAGQIETALAPRIALASGVELLFEPGQTLCAVDVDTGSAGARQGQGPRTPLQANLEAVDEIARQLRLRNIGGIIVVDFIDMRGPHDRNQLQAAMAARLAEDPVPTQVVGMTRLGLMEITRARRGAPLARALGEAGMLEGEGR